MSLTRDRATPSGHSLETREEFLKISPFSDYLQQDYPGEGLIESESLDSVVVVILLLNRVQTILRPHRL